MKITNVEILIPETPTKMLAVSTVTIEDCFVVRDIKVIKSRDKVFIAMPSRKKPNGEWVDIAHPINKETRKLLEEAVLDAYYKAIRSEG